MGYVSKGELPNITGMVNAPVYGSLTPPAGVFYAPPGNWTTLRGDAAAHPPTAFDASRSSSAYWRTDDIVIPYSIIVLFMIKYI